MLTPISKNDLHLWNNDQLSVYITDYFVRKFKDIEIIEGHDARFECEIIENIESCNWIKDDVVLENSEKYNITKCGKKCTLEIVNCGLQDDGVYTVDVNNKKRDVCLYVKGKTIIEQLSFKS